MGLIIDLFAGGGGASEGIRCALGRDPDIAINHNPLAVAMHKANHPGTLHYTQDVWQVPPLWATKGRPVDLLWASPDCTHHSKARGGKPCKKNIRDLAWVVVEWAKQARPRLILLENVEEFRDWGPLDDNDHPIKALKGSIFKKWVTAIRRCGYRVEWRELRACDYGAPTSRNRLFLVARCDGEPINWPEMSHGPANSGLLPYRTAAECIDWSIPCPSIFLDREGARELKRRAGIYCRRPLADNTMRRIARGIFKFVINEAKPYVAFLAKHYGGVIGTDLCRPLGTITAKDHHSLVIPHIIRHFGQSVGSAITDPVGTITAGGGGKSGLVSSYLVKMKGNNLGQDLRQPMQTLTAGGLHFGEVRAFLLKYYGQGIGQSLNEPAATLTSKDRLALVMARGEPYVIADIGMRMLQPKELYLAQGFPSDYIIDMEINGKKFPKEAQVAMVGNSVSPPVATALVLANAGQNELRKTA